MTRRDVILESKTSSNFVYHNLKQRLATMQSLASQYSQITIFEQTKSHNILKIGNNPSSEDRPPVLLYGHGALGAEVALNMAIYFVTHHNRDDTVSTILESVDMRIGFDNQDYELVNTTEPCAGDDQQDMPMVTDLNMHDDGAKCLLNIGLFSGGSGVLTCPTHTRVVDSIAETFLRGIHGVSHCVDLNRAVYTEPKLSHAAIMVGLSCCKVPQNLGEVFDATKKAVIDTLVGVNGVHLHIFDEAGVTVTNNVTITIGPPDNSTANQNNTNILTTTRGQTWHLHEVGSYAVQVTADGFKPVYKLITINQGEISHVRVRLERDAGVPFFVVLAFLTTGFMVVVLTLMACRMDGKRASHDKNSYKFQKLATKKDGIFSDEDSEDDGELEKAMDKIGVKTDYRDEEDSSSSDLEDVLLVNP